MSHWSSGRLLIAIAISMVGKIAEAQEYLYQDDDLLCRPSWSQDTYYERIRQHEYQQMSAHYEAQRTMAYEAAAEQQSMERTKIARGLRVAKEARRREAIIAKRKAENAASIVERPRR